MAAYRLPPAFMLFTFVSLPLFAQDVDSPRDLSGVWMPTALKPDGTMNIKYPEKLPFLPEVEVGLANYLENYNPIVDDAARSCLPFGMPAQMLVTAQYAMEIIQAEGQVTIIAEMHNDVRRIYLDGRNRPQGLLPTWMGYSLGEWEGNDLVIETTNVKEKGYPNPQSRSAVLSERIRKVDGGEVGPMLELEIIINDPVLYAKPFRVSNYFRQYPGLQMGEYFCSEDLWRQNLDDNSGEIPWR